MCNHPTCRNGICRRPIKEKKVYTLKRTPLKKKACKIKAVSGKREVINQHYRRLRIPFLKERRVCEIKSPECMGAATEVHHIKGRGKYLLEVSTWKASCRACNGYVEKHDKWARENGHKESRLN